jgi:hypothetical protein
VTMMYVQERDTERPVTTPLTWNASPPEGKGPLFARLMDEELSKLEKGVDEPITRAEFLDALRAVYERAPTEVQEDIYALARRLVEALKEPAP